MPKYDVKCSFKTDDDICNRNGRRTIVTQRHCGRNRQDAIEACIENLQDEYGSGTFDMEDFKVLSAKLVVPKKKKTPGKKQGKK